MSENPPISINDYVENLVAGRKTIMGIYDAVDRAQNIRQYNNGRFCYKVVLNGIGQKVFLGNELRELDRLSLCTNMYTVFNEVGLQGGVMTVRQAVLLLLIKRNALVQLFQSYYKAIFMRNTIRKMCYTFKNPYAEAINVTKECLQLSGPQILALFDSCNLPRFNALLIWGRLPNPN